MSYVIAFGEMLIRLATTQGVSLKDETCFNTYYGGSEVNVLTLLSAFGQKTRLLTAFPNNSLGDGALQFLLAKGIDTTSIQRNDGRMGLYFYENNFGQLNSRVIYDRANSAVRLLDSRDINYDAFFKEAEWFHTTGITFALGKKTKETAQDLLKEARKRHLMTSFDFNYRSTLTTIDEAKKMYPGIIKNVDVLFGSVNDLHTFLGIRGSDDDAVWTLFSQYPVKVFAYTERNNTDNQTMTMGASLAYHEGNTVRYCHLEPITFPVLDRVGSGDCFDAGVIKGLLDGMNYQRALKLGLGSCILKHEVLGNNISLSLKTVEDYFSQHKFSLTR